MATKYFGVNVGGSMATDVSKSGSTTSRPIELVLDDAATGVNKMEVLKALDAIKQAITLDTFPPA